MNTRKIAILGANGRLGRMVARAFAEAGWQVRAVTRSGNTPVTDVEHIAADAMDEAELIAATRGCPFIFNGLNPKYTEWRKRVMPMARNVMAAAKANGAIHLFPGNVYNFGTLIPEHPGEDFRQTGDHAKAKIRIDAEALFERAAKEDGVKTVILRAGDFFGGDGTGSWFDEVIASKIAKRRFTYPGPANLVHAWAYLPDLAHAFVRLAEESETLPAFSRFHFGGHNITGAQLHEACETALGAKLKLTGFPWPIIKLTGLFVPMMREIGEMAYLWRRPHRLTGEKLEALTGKLPQTPLAKAVADALGDLGISKTATRPRGPVVQSLAA